MKLCLPKEGRAIGRLAPGLTDRVGMMVGVGTRVGVLGTTGDAAAATPDAGIAPAAGSIPAWPDANALAVWGSSIQASAKVAAKNHLRMQNSIDHAVGLSTTNSVSAVFGEAITMTGVGNAADRKDRSGLGQVALQGGTAFEPPLK